jgi:hypothetical protein
MSQNIRTELILEYTTNKVEWLQTRDRTTNGILEQSMTFIEITIFRDVDVIAF